MCMCTYNFSNFHVKLFRNDVSGVVSSNEPVSSPSLQVQSSTLPRVSKGNMKRVQTPGKLKAVVIITHYHVVCVWAIYSFIHSFILQYMYMYSHA